MSRALTIGREINKTLAKVFGANVHPQYAGIDTPTPFAVYNRDTIEREYDDDGYSEVVQVGVSVVANTYAEAVDLAEQVDSLMHRDLRSRLVSAVEGYAIDDKKYIQELNYKIMLK